nr:MAG TPA_asm: hypothetical protein [Caudoviricetes sp.]
MFENIDEKRKKSALAAEMTPLEVNLSNKTGKFVGSDGSIYDTTLEDCSCMDFAFNNGEIACKHILRLAMELGLIPSEGMKSDPLKPLVRYYIGNLRAQVKGAPLMTVLELVANLSQMATITGVKCSNTLFENYGIKDLNDCPIFEPAKAQGKIRVKKEYRKDINSLEKILISRFGELVINHLDNEQLFKVLKSIADSEGERRPS